MATPTIGSLSPVSGPSGGRNLVTIAGTNFRLPTPPSIGPSSGTAPQTVRVRFDGEDALSVKVTASTEIRVEVPWYRSTTVSAKADPLPAVDVEIANLDDAGTPIGGETVTSAGAYTYLRPPVRAPTATLDRIKYKHIIYEVVDLFRRNVHKNTHLAEVSTDFGESGVSVIQPAEVPNISLVGPNLIRDPWRTTHETHVRLNPSTGLYERFLPPATRMFEFRVIGITDRKSEAIALIQAVVELFTRHGYLRPDSVPSDPTEGRDQLPLVLTEEPRLSPSAPGSNLSVFIAEFQVRGIDFELPEPFDAVETADTIEMEVQHKDKAVGLETTEV